MPAPTIKIDIPNHDLASVLLGRIEEEMTAMRLGTLHTEKEYAEFRAASFREAWKDLVKTEILQRLIREDYITPINRSRL